MNFDKIIGVSVGVWVTMCVLHTVGADLSGFGGCSAIPIKKVKFIIASLLWPLYVVVYQMRCVCCYKKETLPGQCCYSNRL